MDFPADGLTAGGQFEYLTAPCGGSCISAGRSEMPPDYFEAFRAFVWFTNQLRQGSKSCLPQEA